MLDGSEERDSHTLNQDTDTEKEQMSLSSLAYDDPEHIRALRSGSRFGSEPKWGPLLWPMLAQLVIFFEQVNQLRFRRSRMDPGFKECLHFLSWFH